MDAVTDAPSDRALPAESALRPDPFPFAAELALAERELDRWLRVLIPEGGEAS